MTSGKQARRQRQQVSRPPVRSTEGRRASPKLLLAALSGLVLLAAAIVLVVVLGSGSGSSATTTPTPLPETDAAVAVFRGIQQRGDVLGSPKAPVTVLEYIDMQCPSCKIFESETMPAILDKYVRTGKVKVEARAVAIIGPDSERGARALVAAGRQNKLFTLSQVLYYNQGPENGGWLSDQTVLDAASGLPGLDVAAFEKALDSSAVKAQEERYDAQRRADNVSGTPTVYVSKAFGPRREVTPGFIPSVEQLSAAIDAALK